MTKEIEQISEEKSIINFEKDSEWEMDFDIDDVRFDRAKFVHSNSDDCKGIEEGTIIDGSNHSKVLAKFGESFEVVFIKQDKLIFELVDDGAELKRVIPYTKNFEEEGVDKKTGEVIERKAVINFYFLAVEDMKTGFAFPLTLQFKSSGMSSGINLINKILKMKFVGKNMSSNVFKISAEELSQKKKHWYIPKAVQGRLSSPQEIKMAVQWRDVLKGFNGNIGFEKDSQSEYKDQLIAEKKLIAENQIIAEKKLFSQSEVESKPLAKGRDEILQDQTTY